MSFLITAATDFELRAFAAAWGDRPPVRQLVTGIGPVETAVNLYRELHQGPGYPAGVLNLGVAGAYPDNGTGAVARMLDICLAGREVLGDLGICLDSGFERFSGPGLRARTVFVPDSTLVASAARVLETAGIPCRTGTFITVNCASGTRDRGCLLACEFQGLCENMEGAAIARVCEASGLPWLEVRCISNMVVDRDPSQWELHRACELAGRAAAVVLEGLYAK